MWQQLLDNSSYPYSEKINYYLNAQSDLYRYPVTPLKFALAGQCFLDLAEKLERDSDRWLKNWQNASYGESECVVAHDWCDWLASRTQQSVNVSFLQKYVAQSERLNHNYPENRASFVREEEIYPQEADLTNLIETAHQEEIEEWGNTVFDYVKKFNQFVSFNDLVDRLDLSPVKIYLGIILSNLFELSASEHDFYGGFEVKPLHI